MPPRKINLQGKAFVAEVMEAVGAKDGVDLANRLYGSKLDPNRQRRVNAWISGETAPNMQGTLDLLRLAGRLKEPGAAGDESDLGSRPILQGLVEAVAELTRSHRQALDDLRDVRSRLAAAEAALAPPRAARGRAQGRSR
jgi:hypothetical protein